MPAYPPLDIVQHWADANEHLVELVDAVPPDKWNWSPEPRMWNFRGIFLHIIAARFFTADEGIPDFWREGQTTEGLQKHLRLSWEHLTRFLLTPEALTAPSPGEIVPGVDPDAPTGHYFAWHRMVHDIHHRADILHYLDVLQADLSAIRRRRPL